MKLRIIAVLTWLILSGNISANHAITVKGMDELPAISVTIVGREPPISEYFRVVDKFLDEKHLSREERRAKVREELKSEYDPILILGIWEDGTIIRWDGDEKEHTYSKLHASPSEVDVLMKEIESLANTLPPEFHYAAVLISDSDHVNLLVMQDSSPSPLVEIVSPEDLLVCEDSFLARCGWIPRNPEENGKPNANQVFCNLWQEIRAQTNQLVDNAELIETNLKIEFDSRKIEPKMPMQNNFDALQEILESHEKKKQEAKKEE